MLNRFPSSIVSGIGFPALPAPAACSHIAALAQLWTSERLPTEILVQHQMTQVRAVIEHAYRSVPYYRSLFDEHRVRLPPVLLPEFMQSIPISTRKLVQAAGDALRSSGLPAAHGETSEILTSGSTGQPVKVLGTAVTRFFWAAFALRENAWHQRDLDKKLGMIRWAPKDVGKAPTGRPAPAWPTLNAVYDTGPSCLLNVATPLAEQIKWLQREKPHYLISFPSNLEALARQCIEHRIALPGLMQVRTIGEMLSPQQRELFKCAWNADTVDLYSCEEAGYLALQCPAHHHYHVQSENVFLEIVDEEGKPCAPHKPGRVLITSLNNFATPLIRYEVGDYAEFGEPCPCGRNLPVLKKILGRKRSRLILPDGRSEFPYIGENGQIHAATGVRVFQFQMVQHSTEEIEVKIVTDRAFTAEEEEKVKDLARKNLGHLFQVRVSRLDDIPKGPTGKFEQFISHAAS